MQKVKIVTQFVKPNYQKIPVSLHGEIKLQATNEYQEYYHSHYSITGINGMQRWRKTRKSYE